MAGKGEIDGQTVAAGPFSRPTGTLADERHDDDDGGLRWWFGSGGGSADDVVEFESEARAAAHASS